MIAADQAASSSAATPPARNVPRGYFWENFLIASAIDMPADIQRLMTRTSSLWVVNIAYSRGVSLLSQTDAFRPFGVKRIAITSECSPKVYWISERAADS